MSLRILVLHNTYQQAGGEDEVVANEAAALREAGHDVRVEIADNAQIATPLDKLRAVANVAWDERRRAWARKLIDDFRPDVVHVHNFFPLLTPAVHAAAWDAGIPVVQTLHNYRLFCAAATFERDGEVCELCLHSSRTNAIRHRCYRGSLAGSAALVHMQSAIEKRGLLAKPVSRFIALTDFARDKMIEGGLPADKLVVKPNFVDGRAPSQPAVERQGMLFVGRLSREKGVRELIEAWRDLPDIPLTIAGSGPLEAQMKSAAPPNVTFLGFVGRERVAEEMRKAAALIVPSLWYEGFPMTLVEAFSAGLPAIVSDLGSLRAIVDHGVTGARFEAGNVQALREAATKLAGDKDTIARMSTNARQVFEQNYTKARNTALLENIYAEAIEHRRAQG